MANTLWDGIVVRCTTNENGYINRNVSIISPDIIASGSIPICSPDIISNGKTPLEDPSILTKPENYGNYYDCPIYEGYTNYLYVRGKNFTSSTLTGSWNLYYSPANLLLYPYMWENNQLATSDGNKNPSFSIDAGKIGVSEDCFTWQPDSSSACGQCYSLVAVAITPGHGNPVAGVNNISDLVTYLANNGNIAQRNINIVTGDLSECNTQICYNQGAAASTIDLSLTFKNLPKGSSYTISCGTPIDGKILSHSETNTQDTNLKIVWTDLNMPANWSSTFSLSINFGHDWSGISANSYPSLELIGELVQNSNDELYHLGKDRDPHPITNKSRTDTSGNPVKVITAGTYQVTFPDKRPAL